MAIKNIPGFGPMNFPDEMSDAEIADAIDRDILPKINSKQKESPKIGAGMAALDAFNAGGSSIARGVLAPLYKHWGTQSDKDAFNKYQKEQEQNLAQAQQQHPDSAFAGELGGGIAGQGPLAAIPGIGEFGPLMKAITQAGLQSGASGFLSNQGGIGERLKSALSNAETGGGLGALFHGAGQVVNKARPSSWLRGTLPPEELAKNLEVAQGTNTGLGDIVGSPYLKKTLENRLPQIPLSGASQKAQQNAQLIAKHGEDLMQSLIEGHEPSDVGEHINTALKDKIGNLHKEKNANYRGVEKAAEEAGIKIPLSKIKGKAREALEGSGVEELVAADPKMKSDLTHITENKGRDEISLKEANIARSLLREKSAKAYENGDKHESGIYKDLVSKLDEEINGALDKSGNEDVKGQFGEAQKFYKEHIAPFENEDLRKFVNKGKDTDLLISHFIKGGKEDRGNLAKKLVEALPEDKKSLPLYGHLSKAYEEDGRLNPLKLRTLIKQLGTKQKEALFRDPKQRQEFENFARLAGLNTESFNTMFNPHNGQRVNDLVGWGALSGILGSGFAMGHLPGAAAAAGLAVGGGRTAQKLLTSPKVREKLVNKMLKPEDKESLFMGSLSAELSRMLGGK
jgi:hypothetical protein